MKTSMSLISVIAAAGLATGLMLSLPITSSFARGNADSEQQTKTVHTANTYSPDEIITAGHNFFGNTTKGLAQAVESVFASSGRPSGYIIGQEGAGAFVGGLRYGEGILYMKNGTQQKVFWQGPSVGFDFGGNGSRTLVLVYDITNKQQIYSRFVGVEGSAYAIGGMGINFQSNDQLKLAPIRTGVGARLGANAGYLKYTSAPTWNPF